MNDKPFVKNASDPKQVKDGKRKERFLEEKDLNDLRGVLQSRYGRRFLWRLLEYCRVFESIWRMSAEIHYLAGTQDVGHFLMAKIIEADEESLFLMMKENKERKNG